MKKWLLICMAVVFVVACSEQEEQQATDNTTTAEASTDSQGVLDKALALMPAYGNGTVFVELADGTKHDIAVEIAKTPEQQAYGLMFRKSVPENTGMLFIWDEPHPVEFWMRNTLVSLDMFFVGPDNKIISIKKSATPRSEEHIPSGGDVIAVVEMLSGESSRLGIAVGDTVTWDETPTEQKPEEGGEVSEEDKN